MLMRRTLVPLKDMCSRKCAVPLLTSVSYLLPASIHTPTVAVSVNGLVSDATRNPLGRVVICDTKLSASDNLQLFLDECRMGALMNLCRWNGTEYLAMV